MKLNRGVTFLVVAAVGAGVMAGASAISPDVRASIASASPDLLSVMRARSPGERAAGAETNKHKMAEVTPAALPPTAKVLSERAPVAAPAAAPAIVPGVAPVAAAPVGAPIPPAAAAVVPAVLAAPAVIGGTGAGLGALGALVPAAGIVALGGGGGGGGTVTISPAPAPAVPEPATWLMMITGIGFLGGALRRRRNRQTGDAGRVHALAKVN